MVSLKQKQSGFTIVELLIVIVIIGILAGLVITTFVGIQAKARDTERKTDINSLASQLEGYFAQKSGYPSLTDINNTAWRTGNNVKLGDGGRVLGDPSDSTTPPQLQAAVAANKYSYVPSPANCNSPTLAGGGGGVAPFCTTYVLTATLEAAGAGTYVKNSAN